VKGLEFSLRPNKDSSSCSVIGGCLGRESKRRSHILGEREEREGHEFSLQWFHSQIVHKKRLCPLGDIDRGCSQRVKAHDPFLDLQ